MTVVPEMNDAEFIAIREGFYPQRFQLEGELSPGNTVRRKVVLREAPAIRLRVVQQNGSPANDAKLTYVGPQPRGPYFPLKRADQAGVIEMRFPAWGEQAVYGLSYETMQVRMELEKWISKVPQDGSLRPIDVSIALPGNQNP